MKGFSFSRKHLAIPYGIFLLLFVVFPLLLVVANAFTSNTGTFTFSNFVWFFTDNTNLKTLLVSVLVGLFSTLACIIIGYPIAYIISKIKTKMQFTLLLLFIMPMWINFVLRAMAMKEILYLIGFLGKYDFLNTVIGMTYDYLPFMILPLYSVLIKIDKSYKEASLDLGANRVKTFLKITLPLSASGIVSGITMVFLPSMTCYVISQMFTNGKVVIIGELIQIYYHAEVVNCGAVIALVMLVIMVLTNMLTDRFAKQENTRGTIL